MAVQTPAKGTKNKKSADSDNDAVAIAEDALSKSQFAPAAEDEQDNSTEQVEYTSSTEDPAAQAIEVFDPLTEPRRWVIGKPPELGGNEKQYAVYVQDQLGYMPRIKFFALVANTIAKALKQGADIDLPGLDLRDGLSMRERAQLISQGSLESTADFMHLALQLVAYSPQFLVQCYVLWLDVPRDDRAWAMEVMSQPWNPERGKYGLKQSDGIEMIATFIDQNYEDIRDFFAVELPKLLRRVQKREEERQALASE